MIVLKNIEMTLDPDSIEKAIQAVNDLKDNLERATTRLIEHLTEQGVDFARIEIIMFDKPPYDSGELYDSISAGMQNAHEGVVVTGVMYAAFVEYGTGIVGANEPHPNPEGYTYDVNGHGWDGWVYGSDGAFHHTYGMPSRPFMYRALRDLEDYAERNGGQIIAEYIREEERT